MKLLGGLKELIWEKPLGQCLAILLAFSKHCRHNRNYCCYLLIFTNVAVLLILPPVTDYIRTFTWDKKLEMVVKSTGILGGQGEQNFCLFFKLFSCLIS